MYFDLKQYSENFINCPWCGQDTKLEFVRGHYECISCKRPVLDCCDGEQNQKENKA